MEEKESTLNVIYSSDDNYVQHMGVSIISLLEHNKEFVNINIFIIDNEISNESKEKLIVIANNYNREIYFIDFNKYKQKLNLNMETYISISSYARLFIQEMVPQSIEKILYIDCDTIINDSLINLWNINIDNYTALGVKDLVGKKAKSKIGLNDEENYLNAGILLINIKEWRKNDIQQKFIDFIEENKGNVYHHDQGVINAVLHDSTLVVPLKYNAMTPVFTMTYKRINEFYKFEEGDFYSEEQIKEAKESPVIIHFTPAFTTRPWFKECKHPMKNEYIKYLRMSPWKDYKLQKSNDKLKLKIIKWMYNYLPFSVYKFITKKAKS